uniref:Fibrinogen C-terminal domain-containing protein n=1 Tax=Magallana gigas TaxID=29159 RepID=A0A8W8P3N2_MAGGI
MWTLVVITMVVWGVDAKGIKLHLSDEIKSMLGKSDWDHQDTALSIHGPVTLDIHSSFKLKKGRLFLNSRNDAIHALTKDKNQILRIDMMKFSREKGHATYSSFFVDNEANKYQLKLGSFNGTKGLGDSFIYCNNMYFSTKDRDNDNAGGTHCVQKYKSPGWMNNCFSANLNGVYKASLKQVKDFTVLHWYIWGNVVPLKSAKMMIRPKQTN